MKEIKKIIITLLSLFLLTSCIKNKETIVKIELSKNNTYNLIEEIESLDGTKSIDVLKNYTVRKKNKNNSVENESFNIFLDSLFKDSLENDYLNMHYTITNYKEMGIEKPELSLGEIEYDDKSDLLELLEWIKKLHEFDYDSLAYDQQYDYECLEYSLIESIAYSFYQNYEQLYDGKNDILSNIIINFDEYVFYDQESIDDYLVLLTDIQNYLDKTLVYTSKQAINGLHLTDIAIDSSLDYISSFVSKKENNALIESFNSKIDDVDFLTDTEKEAYKIENRRIIIEDVIPEFEKVKEELKQYKGKIVTEDNVLYKINKEYAELTYMLATSNNTDINEVFTYAKEKFDDYLALANSALYDKESIELYLSVNDKEIEPFNQNYSEIMDFLANNYNKCFPDVGDIDYDLTALDESIASNNILAYYVVSPIDNIKQNTIRINPNSMGLNSVKDYFTLAHEGIPGHMYQYYYCHDKNIKRFRQVLSFLGYQEGYACYASNESLYLNDNLKKGAIDLLFIDNFGVYILDSIVDMGINYFAWNKEDVAKYLEECGYSSYYVSSMFDDLIDRHTVLCSYGIGYLNFIYLKDYAKKELQERFDERTFNETILKNGQLPFAILKGAVDEYIASN